MDAHAAKPLSRKIRGTFNDYPLGEKHQQEYGANKGVGENPLNGKGMPLPGNAEGEEIVCSHVKA